MNNNRDKNNIVKLNLIDLSSSGGAIRKTGTGTITETLEQTNQSTNQSSNKKQKFVMDLKPNKNREKEDAFLFFTENEVIFDENFMQSYLELDEVSTDDIDKHLKTFGIDLDVIRKDYDDLNDDDFEKINEIYEQKEKFINEDFKEMFIKFVEEEINELFGNKNLEDYFNPEVKDEILEGTFKIDDLSNKTPTEIFDELVNENPLENKYKDILEKKEFIDRLNFFSIIAMEYNYINFDFRDSFYTKLLKTLNPQIQDGGALTPEDNTKVRWKSFFNKFNLKNFGILSAISTLVIERSGLKVWFSKIKEKVWFKNEGKKFDTFNFDFNYYDEIFGVNKTYSYHLLYVKQVFEILWEMKQDINNIQKDIKDIEDQIENIESRIETEEVLMNNSIDKYKDKLTNTKKDLENKLKNNNSIMNDLQDEKDKKIKELQELEQSFDQKIDERYFDWVNIKDATGSVRNLAHFIKWNSNEVKSDKDLIRKYREVYNLKCKIREIQGLDETENNVNNILSISNKINTLTNDINKKDKEIKELDDNINNKNTIFQKNFENQKIDIEKSKEALSPAKEKLVKDLNKYYENIGNYLITSLSFIDDDRKNKFVNLFKKDQSEDEIKRQSFYRELYNFIVNLFFSNFKGDNNDLEYFVKFMKIYLAQYNYFKFLNELNQKLPSNLNNPFDKIINNKTVKGTFLKFSLEEETDETSLYHKYILGNITSIYKNIFRTTTIDSLTEDKGFNNIIYDDTTLLEYINGNFEGYIWSKYKIEPHILSKSQEAFIKELGNTTEKVDNTIEEISNDYLVSLKLNIANELRISQGDSKQRITRDQQDSLRKLLSNKNILGSSFKAFKEIAFAGITALGFNYGAMIGVTMAFISLIFWLIVPSGIGDFYALSTSILRNLNKIKIESTKINKNRYEFVYTNYCNNKNKTFKNFDQVKKQYQTETENFSKRNLIYSNKFIRGYIKKLLELMDKYEEILAIGVPSDSEKYYPGKNIVKGVNIVKNLLWGNKHNKNKHNKDNQKYLIYNKDGVEYIKLFGGKSSNLTNENNRSLIETDKGRFKDTEDNFNYELQKNLQDYTVSKNVLDVKNYYKTIFDIDEEIKEIESKINYLRNNQREFDDVRVQHKYELLKNILKYNFYNNYFLNFCLTHPEGEFYSNIFNKSSNKDSYKNILRYLNINETSLNKEFINSIKDLSKNIDESKTLDPKTLIEKSDNNLFYAIYNLNNESLENEDDQKKKSYFWNSGQSELTDNENLIKAVYTFCEKFNEENKFFDFADVGKYFNKEPRGRNILLKRLILLNMELEKVINEGFYLPNFDYANLISQNMPEIQPYGTKKRDQIFTDIYKNNYLKIHNLKFTFVFDQIHNSKNKLDLKDFYKEIAEANGFFYLINHMSIFFTQFLKEQFVNINEFDALSIGSYSSLKSDIFSYAMVNSLQREGNNLYDTFKDNIKLLRDIQTSENLKLITVTDARKDILKEQQYKNEENFKKVIGVLVNTADGFRKSGTTGAIKEGLKSFANEFTTDDQKRVINFAIDTISILNKDRMVYAKKKSEEAIKELKEKNDLTDEDVKKYEEIIKKYPDLKDKEIENKIKKEIQKETVSQQEYQTSTSTNQSNSVGGTTKTERFDRVFAKEYQFLNIDDVNNQEQGGGKIINLDDYKIAFF